MTNKPRPDEPMDPRTSRVLSLLDQAQQLEALVQHDPYLAHSLIACYEQAVELLRHGGHPTVYVAALEGLGNAYQELPTGDRTANLMKAIACYQEDLRIWPPQTDPLTYASAMVNRGNVEEENVAC